MQPVGKEDLEKLIEEAKAEGKDTSELERRMREKAIEPTVGQEKRKPVKKGHHVILSTGPAREEDFE